MEVWCYLEMIHPLLVLVLLTLHINIVLIFNCYSLLYLLWNRRHDCDRYVTWNAGALHYSDEVIMVQDLSEMSTRAQELKTNIDRITYIGKGTYTDCAIKHALGELLSG